MKNYIKPSIEYVELTVEERLAAGSPCRKENGACTIDSEVVYWN